MVSVREIIKDASLSLPIRYANKSSFPELVMARLGSFMDSLKNVDISESEHNFLFELISTIPIIIKEYYEGNLSKSYTLLSDIFNKSDSFLLRFPKYQYPSNSSFFRIRTNKYLTDKKLKRSDLFHHPFENRGKVSSQRYSIPGFPCLYVGDSLYVCWEELNRPDLRRVQAVCLKNTNPFYVYNIDLSVYGNELKISSMEEGELRSYLLLWPLFAVCAIEVKDDHKSNPFKPEYIFSQLLLQYFIPKFPNFLPTPKSAGPTGGIGIQYSSTRVSSILHKKEGNSFTNLVLPPLSKLELSLGDSKTIEKGHSEHLKFFFKMTKVIDIGQNPFPVPKSQKRLKVKTIELFEGIESDYAQTELGKIEQYLRSLPATPIDFK